MNGPGDRNVPAGGSYAENANFWIKIIRENLDRYRIGLTNQAVLDAVGPVDGLRVLDAGCGEGYLSRILASRGAHAVGIDFCADLIEAARDAADAAKLDIDYHVGSVAELPFEDASFDVVVCNHLVNDLQDPGQPFGEFARVLKPGGRLVILMLHPCFYGSQAERTAFRGELDPDEYFSVLPVTQEFRVAGITSPAPVTIWVRPLEAYVSLLAAAGFAITGLREPHPSAEQRASDSWWQDNFRRPLFLLLVAEKV